MSTQFATEAETFPSLPAKNFITVMELARYLGVSRGMAYHLTQSGEIPSVKIGARMVRIPRANLEAYLKEQLSDN